MPTNLAIDGRLIEEGKNIGKHRTKKGAVTEALQELIKEARAQLIGPVRQELLRIGDEIS